MFHYRISENPLELTPREPALGVQAMAATLMFPADIRIKAGQLPGTCIAWPLSGGGAAH